MTIRFQHLSPLILTVLLHLAAGQPALAKEEAAPITIEADHMASAEKESSVIFTGEVDARQANVRIRTDKMTVFYTDKAKSEAEAKVKQKVEKLVCNGNVQITRDEWLGTAKDMIYLSEKRQFVLIGDAKAWQGKNMVSGDRIIYYLDEGRSEVMADPAASASTGQAKEPGRVKMTIIQQ